MPTKEKPDLKQDRRREIEKVIAEKLAAKACCPGGRHPPVVTKESGANTIVFGI